MYNQEWEIKPRAIACKTCQQPFFDGQIYVSSLRLNGPEYERSDCCENCWKQDAVSGAFSVWRGNFQAAPPPPPEVLKKETAESLLRKLIEKNEPVYRNAIFILAVMLERRRILSEKPARPPAAPGAQRLRAGNATHPPATLARSDCGLGSVAGGEVQKKDDNIMIRVYEHRKTGETFIVSDPMLSLDQLGHVQEEVAALLSGQDGMPVTEECSFIGNAK